MAVGVGQLARAERLPDVDELAAGGDDDDPRTRAAQRRGAAGRGEQADLRGAEVGAGGKHERAFGQILAGPADVLTAAAAPA